MVIDRYDDLVALRTQAACRLHVALRELIAGGAPRRLGAAQAAQLLRSVCPQGAAGVERKRLALELVADVRSLGACQVFCVSGSWLVGQMRPAKRSG